MQNEYLLADIGADTAENESTFGTILPRARECRNIFNQLWRHRDYAGEQVRHRRGQARPRGAREEAQAHGHLRRLRDERRRVWRGPGEGPPPHARWREYASKC